MKIIKINNQKEGGIVKLPDTSILINGAEYTNFVFQINNVEFTDNEIDEINKIATRSKIKDRIQTILNKGGSLDFVEVENKTFRDNLILIDSCLHRILSELVYLFFTSNKSEISDLIAEIKHKNPLKYNVESGHPFYEYKIKRFLTDIALGMQAASLWTGQLDATGGYLVVKGNGEILCYHIYNRNEFEDYLYMNTKLETASSSRHRFGKIYKKEGKLYFNLNLQIRFK